MNSSVSEFGKDLGLMHEVVVTGRKVGFTSEDWGKLAHNRELMESIHDVLSGFSEIKPIEHVIDCDALPMIPNGLTIEKHMKMGALRFVREQVKLFLSKKQKSGIIGGHDLRKELENERVLNACVLDYLLKHPHLIPDDWKGRAVFFWGTIYCDVGGNLFVRYLNWNGGRWCSNDRYLDDVWREGHPAAVLGK